MSGRSSWRFYLKTRKGWCATARTAPLFFAVLRPKSLKARLSLAGARWWHTANWDVEDLAGHRSSLRARGAADPAKQPEAIRTNGIVHHGPPRRAVAHERLYPTEGDAVRR